MESRVKILGHPLHPVLIVFPLGLLSTAVIFDVIHLLDQAGPWSLVGYYMIGAGVILGLVAAVVGLLDWLAIPDNTRAKRIGLWHAVANVVVLTLFILSWFLRRADPVNPDAAALLLSFAGVAVSLFSGWLGGEMVFRLGVAVDPDANLDAPNSLTNEPPQQDEMIGAPRSSRAARR